MSQYEEPSYELIKKFESFEIRKYSPTITAKTQRSTSNYQGSSGGFRVIAEYIFGNNSTNQKISMTSPVHIWKENSSESYMSFTMPSEFKLNDLPKPNDERVSIEKIDQKTAAVLKFSGLSGEAKTEKLIKKLSENLARESIEIVGPPCLAIYDNPWSTLPFQRRNEIQIPVNFGVEKKD